ncbi:MAG: NAD(P)-dependent oxidoreductase [Halobacteriales archaeon]|nr:NAD(P)-dependent oxidoreductase [Halobacteriales archaeon]
MPALGFIGLGDMGEPMATHLVDAGHAVTVYDIRQSAIESLVDAGAVGADSIPAVAEAAEVIFLSLPTPADVEDVVAELAPTIDPGDVLIDTTTSTPQTTAAVADRLADHGVDVLGAPVSGGTTGAQAGTLSVMMGGDRAVYEACKPLVDAFAADVFHVGPAPGHGHGIKLLNNYLSFTGLIAASEATLLGQRIGLDLETMCRVFTASSGRNSATEDKLPNHVATGSYDMGFPLRLMEKDIRLLTEFSEHNETPLLLAAMIRQLVGYARTQQGAEADMTRIYDFLETVMIRE